jgi:E3 ubiquitin-protein ligase synoviolin
MSRRQAKLEAAAAAASLYGTSFVYPPANTLNRYVYGTV